MTTVALTIRDAMLSRLAAKPFFTGFARTSKTKALQVWTEHVPYLGCYFISESLTPDGDDNAGEVRFRSMARYGFSVIVKNNDPDLAEAQLDLAFTEITSLFADPTLYDGADAKIQAFAAGDRSHSYGNAGLDNTTPIAELRFDLSCDLGTITWPPTVEDDLEVVHVTVTYPTRDSPDPFSVQYDFFANTPTPLVVQPVLGKPALVCRAVASGVGGFALAGQVGLRQAHLLGAGAGALDLAGQEPGLRQGVMLSAEAGGFVPSGQAL